MTEDLRSTDRPVADPGSPALQRGERIRLRAVLIGALLALTICLITPFNNAHLQGTPLGGGQFPLAPFYILVWMVILTGLLRSVFKGHRFLTGRELLVMWALMVLLSGIAWTGLARTFFINLTAPYHFATAENRWEEVLQPLLPHLESSVLMEHLSSLLLKGRHREHPYRGRQAQMYQERPRTSLGNTLPKMAL